MNIAQVENSIQKLFKAVESGKCSQEDFIYELLIAYGRRKSSVGRLRPGKDANLAKVNGEVISKGLLYFKPVAEGDVAAEFDAMCQEKLVVRNKTRFVIATDFQQLMALDTKAHEQLAVEFKELPAVFDFFLPWSGMEKAVYREENPADIKAAEKMAKLFEAIKADNFDSESSSDPAALHKLNVFLTRLLFCFFAEDTEIFKANQFSQSIASHTKEDGSDCADYLSRFFKVLNTIEDDRGKLPDYLTAFPYVNGGLFAEKIKPPVFSKKSRKMLIDCGSDLDWSEIHPDIFGSMIQAVIHPDQRGGMGIHYTSVTNIMKVIDPLFLNDLYEELGKSESSSRKLKKLQQRLGEIKIFDPACGSGNFLIIAYKELRKLEMEVLIRLQEIELEDTGQISQPFSVIKLSQFYGIELDDFAHEVAILSLWLAEHQMNIEFKSEFGDSAASLPLKKSGYIYCGNATRLNWESVCPDSEKVFLVGNPPYKGSRVQSDEQKEDMGYAFSGYKTYKDLDYVSCWFIKAAKYIKGGSKAAFVSTSSICQGTQVTGLWPYIFKEKIEIDFAYKSFHWTNNAKNKAGVTCSIIGLRAEGEGKRKSYLYADDKRIEVNNINAYLISGDNVFVKKSRKPIWNLPVMLAGNYTGHAQSLMLSDQEKVELLKSSPESVKFLRKVIGSNELIKGLSRWCLWISDDEKGAAELIPEIYDRIKKVKDARAESKDKEANKIACRPHQFRDFNETKKQSIVVPTVSSERREYLPIDFIGRDTVVTNKAMVLYDCDIFVFGLIMSKMHMSWVNTIAGRMRKDISYSSVLCYNTFPVPDLNDEARESLSLLSMEIIRAREEHSDKSLAKLYDPEKMPGNLRKAHSDLDRYVDTLYSNKGFSDNDERLQYLFEMYGKMTGGRNA